MAHRRTVEPTVRPVNWEQLKAQCRITTDDERLIGEQYLDVATQWVEEITQRALLSQAWELTLDGFGDCRHVTNGVIYVPRPPLLAVSSIVYLATDGTSTTLSSSDYRVVTSSHPGRIEEAYGEVWQSTYSVLGSVTITHTAGYGTTAASVPVALRQAVLLMAANLFREREPVLTGSISKELEFSLMALLDPYVMEVYA